MPNVDARTSEVSHGLPRPSTGRSARAFHIDPRGVTCIGTANPAGIASCRCSRCPEDDTRKIVHPYPWLERYPRPRRLAPSSVGSPGENGRPAPPRFDQTLGAKPLGPSQTFSALSRSGALIEATGSG